MARIKGSLFRNSNCLACDGIGEEEIRYELYVSWHVRDVRDCVRREYCVRYEDMGEIVVSWIGCDELEPMLENSNNSPCVEFREEDEIRCELPMSCVV